MGNTGIIYCVQRHIDLKEHKIDALPCSLERSTHHSP